ncbi:EAL domain-containing protein [Shewanella putrefaciens]|uniref:GGDEF domain-containing protein n=1 Tax=Shewanella putrefaciens TaxID=24 RepID=A0ABX8XH12_SHEPU|nr:GGDEF domain-containing protein [Shewanella putrefaciens]MCT8941822.1 GGDEF domain-containing protein [Shewanella putrefaciens]QSE51110.1 GGDEF domain-containing protein [Shewanella putrefaciens]QYX74521.1 GGDEF domain-containing protein [Shewanella putrefaciens]GGN17547.1 diguanylate cyclase [Shewanella putrefaciens]
MTMSKSYPVFLLLIFLALFAGVFQNENSQLQIQQQQELERFKRDLTAYSQWQGSGKDLFNALSIKYPFQFFQYINDTDGELNHTEGSLTSDNAHPLAGLFSVDLSHTQKLATGRLQVKLSANAQIAQSISNTEKLGLMLLLSFIILLAIFTFLMAKLKTSIQYAADYVSHISDLSFSALAASKLNGELNPLKQVLEDCRHQLKVQLDTLTQENEKLHKVAYQDPITGFASRPRFTNKLETINNPDIPQFGLMVMVKATELANINQHHGRSAGDDYLARVANCIRKTCTKYPDAQCYRVSSADFAVFIPDTVLKDGPKFLDELKVYLDEYQQMTKTESVAHIGLVPYQQGVEAIYLLTLADTAVSIAQTLGPNSYHIQEKLDGNEQFGDDRWKLAIHDLISRKALKFYQQPIQPCRTEVEVYRELLARFYNSEGKFLPTTTVIAMAERHGMSTELDKLVVISALKMLKENPTINGNFGVNISAFSAHQELFVGWLKDILGKQKYIASRLVFEINESGMQSNLGASHKFVRDVHSVGSRVSIERFGMSFTSFKFFSEVRPDYIKLDGSYTSNIDEDNNNKFFVRMMVDVARRIGIRVIATSVERQEEKLTLEKLLVDGLQGYYIAQPQAITSRDQI